MTDRLDSTAVREVAQLAQEALSAEERIFEVDGRHYSRMRLQEIVPAYRTPPWMRFQTLTGLRDYVLSRLDPEEAPCAINVRSPNSIEYVTGPRGAARDRNMKAQSFQDVPWDSASGIWNEVETTIIQLQTLCEPTGDRDALIRILSNVSSEEVVVSEDDGVSQKLGVRAGVFFKEQAAIPNPVMLRPFRTFAEVEQPKSPFIVRARKLSKISPIEIGIIECDNGLWKIAAMNNVRRWLEFELEVPIADGSLFIFA